MNERSAPSYPIEVEFPDIEPYALGNCAIPYVHSFDSGVAGPHVMINSLTHGNEVCGAILAKALLDLQVRPRRGRLTVAFANFEAYRRFDRQRPDASRFVDQDFNRIWMRSVLDDAARESSELRRARALRPSPEAAILSRRRVSSHRSCGLLTETPDLSAAVSIPDRDPIEQSGMSAELSRTAEV